MNYDNFFTILTILVKCSIKLSITGVLRVNESRNKLLEEINDTRIFSLFGQEKHAVKNCMAISSHFQAQSTSTGNSNLSHSHHSGTNGQGSEFYNPLLGMQDCNIPVLRDTGSKTVNRGVQKFKS